VCLRVDHSGGPPIVVTRVTRAVTCIVSNGTTCLGLTCCVASLNSDYCRLLLRLSECVISIIRLTCVLVAAIEFIWLYVVRLLSKIVTMVDPLRPLRFKSQLLPRTDGP
jgi:hypothetical protein